MARKKTKSRKRSRKTTDAMRILDTLTGNDASLRRMIEDETVNARVAIMVYKARTAADLTQAQLAELVGTTQSVIARLEDADYEGHSLSMLQRIASALNRKLEVRMVPQKRSSKAA